MRLFSHSLARMFWRTYTQKERPMPSCGGPSGDNFRYMPPASQADAVWLFSGTALWMLVGLRTISSPSIGGGWRLPSTRVASDQAI